MMAYAVRTTQNALATHSRITAIDYTADGGKQDLIYVYVCFSLDWKCLQKIFKGKGLNTPTNPMFFQKGGGGQGLARNRPRILVPVLAVRRCEPVGQQGGPWVGGGRRRSRRWVVTHALNMRV